MIVTKGLFTKFSIKSRMGKFVCVDKFVCLDKNKLLFTFFFLINSLNDTNDQFTLQFIKSSFVSLIIQKINF